MKPYSIELREKIVKIYEQGDTSIRKVAARFDVSKGFVQKILKQKQTTGHVQPKQLSWKPQKCVKLAPD
jgi:transposase